MKVIIVLLIEYLIFITLSILIRYWMIKVKTNWIYLVVPVYLLAINSYFDLLNWLTNSLREKSIYLDVGHANIGLLILCLIFYITAIVFIINIIILRRRKWKL